MSDSEDDVPLSMVAKRNSSESDSESESESESEQQQNDSQKEPKDKIRWKTLQHRGPLFPDPYQPINVPLIYDKQEVLLPPECEEVAGFFAQLLDTDYPKNPTFVTNFFNDFKALCDQHKLKITQFKKCNFTKLKEYYDKQRELRKQLTKEEKLNIKEEKTKIDKEYGYCLLDGKEEKVGNFRVEPPGLFKGRGQHPKTGCLKKRVLPEQVTINIGKECKVPEAPQGHSWGSVINDQTVTWLAMWKENVNDSFNLKRESDIKKFEKARELKGVINKVRDWYEKGMKDNAMAIRQLATCFYFIDKLALRAGNEKGEDEADTVGCCSLRFEHVTVKPPNELVFDFLGKDSIRYVNTVQVTEQVFKNIKIFKKEPKSVGDDLFDRVTTSLVNKKCQEFMSGLTAKVFRTYNASFTFQEELKKTPMDGTVNEKILAYNRANRQVAVLCNHQRAVPKSHGQMMSRMNDRVLMIKLCVDELLEHPDISNKRRKELEGIERLSDKEVERCLELEREKERKKEEKKISETTSDGVSIKKEENTKKTAKDDSEAEEEKPKKKRSKKLDDDDSEAEEEKPKKKRSKKLDDDDEEPKKRKRAKVEEDEMDEKPNKKKKNVEQLEKKLSTLETRVSAAMLQLVDKVLYINKDENKQTALGTSKINYIDPRITVAWCKKYGVPTEKMFNKSLREKFTWAMDVDADYVF